jgi:hypothetical protein
VDRLRNGFALSRVITLPLGYYLAKRIERRLT